MCGEGEYVHVGQSGMRALQRARWAAYGNARVAVRVRSRGVCAEGVVVVGRCCEWPADGP